MGMRISIHDVGAVAAYGLCNGCGACVYACENGAIELRNFTSDGIRPVVDKSRCKSCQGCLEVCSGYRLEDDARDWPAGALGELARSWGRVLEVWEGHAADEEIWFSGGSGGAATALSLYCIEREGAGGVLHVGMDPQRPYMNRTAISRTRGELLARTGSRYAPAAVCADLGAIERSVVPMVLVGKPCDIASATRARRQRPQLDRKLHVTISIFCAGTPSTAATLSLLRALGVSEQEITELRYRGRGWPGMTGVATKDGNGQRAEMPYRKAWDEILTKHVPFRCKICPDGTGQFADIACGDPWYRPIEEGERGSSLIVVRTEQGRAIVRGAMEAGYLVAERRTPDVLPRSQAGLLMRRRSLWPKVAWARIWGWPMPKFRGLDLLRNWLDLPLRLKWVSFVRAGRHLWGLRKRGPQRPTAEDVGEAEVVRPALGEPGACGAVAPGDSPCALAEGSKR